MTSTPMRILVFTALLALAMSSDVAAQNIDKLLGTEKARDKFSLPDALQPKTGEQQQRLVPVPMEGPVDPAAYVLGPSDILTIGVWGPVSFMYPATVTPEGSIIIPTVGEVALSSTKLNDGKKRIIDAVRKRYPIGDVTVTLTSPRSFVVTLKGAVLLPGVYVATAVDRVEKILLQGTVIKSLTPTVSIPVTPSEPSFKKDEIAMPHIPQNFETYEQASTRNVLLVRRNGDTVRVDIPKYHATGNNAFNPFLLDGDVILVPQKNLASNFVSISGAVNAPGQYEYVEGDRLSDLLHIAEGTTADAAGTIVVSRLDADGRTEREIRSSLDAVRAGGSADVPLQRADRITLIRNVDRRGDYRVMIAGEVQIPGEYPVTRDATRLSAIVRAAGGFTTDALLNGSVVFRRTGDIETVIGRPYNVLRNIRSARFNLVDSSYYFNAMKVGLEPVSIDFARLFSAGDSTQDVVLRDGDIVYVASNRHTVLVSGQVANPGHQPYIPGAEFEFYIRRAGGYTEHAEESDARVIKNGTLTWVEPDDTVVESGDQVFVPKHVPKDFTFYLSIFRDVAAFTTALATTGLLIYQISNAK